MSGCDRKNPGSRSRAAVKAQQGAKRRIGQAPRSRGAPRWDLITGAFGQKLVQPPHALATAIGPALPGLAPRSGRRAVQALL